MTEKAGPPPSYYESQSGFPTGQVAGGYPQQGAGGYPQQGTGGYPQQGAGGYPPQGAGGYPQDAGYLQDAGYPQGAGYPVGQYPSKSQPGPYEQPGYTQPGYGQGYAQQTTQAVIVHQPGAAGHVILQPSPAYCIVASIFASILCFWPTGLCVIYYATQANKLAAEGDMAGAIRMSDNARSLFITSIVIGMTWIGLGLVVRAVVYSN